MPFNSPVPTINKPCPNAPIKQDKPAIYKLNSVKRRLSYNENISLKCYSI